MKKSSKLILKIVDQILKNQWKIIDGKQIPKKKNLPLNANDACTIEGAVLYADLRSSTALVQTYNDDICACIYKSFLRSVCDVIRNNDGEITAFDGDRVMAVYYGPSKCSNAARTGLQIRYIIDEINKKIINLHPKLFIDYAVGIDVSELFIIKTGITLYNDLAWIGTAANIAAKLSEMSDPKDKTFITRRVFDRLNDDSKFSANSKKCMWHYSNKKILDEEIWASSWLWIFN